MLHIFHTVCLGKPIAKSETMIPPIRAPRKLSDAKTKNNSDPSLDFDGSMLTRHGHTRPFCQEGLTLLNRQFGLLEFCLF